MFIFEVCEAGYDRGLWVFSHSVHPVELDVFRYLQLVVDQIHSPPTSRSLVIGLDLFLQFCEDQIISLRTAFQVT